MREISNEVSPEPFRYTAESLLAIQEATEGVPEFPIYNINMASGIFALPISRILPVARVLCCFSNVRNIFPLSDSDRGKIFRTFDELKKPPLMARRVLLRTARLQEAFEPHV